MKLIDNLMFDQRWYRMPRLNNLCSSIIFLFDTSLSLTKPCCQFSRGATTFYIHSCKVFSPSSFFLSVSCLSEMKFRPEKLRSSRGVLLLPAGRRGRHNLHTSSGEARQHVPGQKRGDMTGLISHRVSCFRAATLDGRIVLLPEKTNV